MMDKSLHEQSRLVDAVRAIEASPRRIAVVLSEDRRILGTLTDGDVRRCLLAGGSLDTPVTDAMNPRPVLAPVGSSDGHLLDQMKRANILAVPLVDTHGRLVRMVHRNDLDPDAPAGDAVDFEFAVIMAGGQGMRLRPITESIPKPMVDIGGMPLLGRQIERLSKAGLRRIYLSLNYLGHVIEEHFGDGSEFGLDIRYLRETQPLGTAGALTLLPERPSRPILVMNGDILTTSDFGSLHAFHHSHGADVTVAAVDYRISIPFGVIHTDGPFVSNIVEKPSQRFLCNAGIYAVSPAALDRVPQGHPSNMTDLIESCVRSGRRWPCFPCTSTGATSEPRPISSRHVISFWRPHEQPAQESIAGRKVFVTGADGFIGSHLVELLVAEGADVRAMVYYNSWNERGWLRDVPADTLKSVELFNGDIRDTERVRKGVEGCDYVFHLASLIAIPYSYEAPRAYVETNVTGGSQRAAGLP
jgi:NDP-sugar pyrophosphorylase family protein